MPVTGGQAPENAENQLNSTTAIALGLVSWERTVPATGGFASEPQQWVSDWPALTQEVCAVRAWGEDGSQPVFLGTGTGMKTGAAPLPSVWIFLSR